MPVNPTTLQTLQYRKPHRNLMSTGRPRGRPPNVNKYLQHALQQSGNVMGQFSSKGNFANYMGASGPNRSMINPYFMSPLVDANMLSAILASGLSGNMMDPLAAMTYLNQVGSYQDILRQYQNNLSSLTNLASGLNKTTPGTTISSISNVSTMSTSSSNINTSSNIANLNNLKGSLDPMTASMQQLLSLSNSITSTSRPTPMYHQAAAKTSTTMSITKDRPNISITPVTTSMSQQPYHKIKQPSSQTEPVLPVHIPKSLQISPTKPVLHSSNATAQVSLLKPSIIQQVKSSPPKQMSAPLIRVSKSLTEPQPAHNSSLSHSPLKNSGSTVTTNPTASMSHVAHASMGAPVIMKQQQALPMNLPNVSRSGTSLQHKLLSKKNSQRPYTTHTNVQNHPVRKAKSTAKTAAMTVPMSGNFPNLLNAMPPAGSAAMSQPPFIPPELSGISVSPVGSQPGSGIKTATVGTKYHSYKKSVSKPKLPATPAMEVPSSLPASFSSGSSVEALSMLSQLQQHSHLEIIPQQKAPLKPSIDFSKTLSSSVSVMPPKVPETLRPSIADCMPMYDISRGKTANVSNKKTQDKLLADNVEIITLDD